MRQNYVVPRSITVYGCMGESLVTTARISSD